MEFGENRRERPRGLGIEKASEGAGAPGKAILRTVLIERVGGIQEVLVLREISVIVIANWARRRPH